MARDCVGQPGAQHDEFVLAFPFGDAAGTAHGAVETPQLAARARVHIPHSSHHCVRLVIQIKRIRNQLVQIDLRRSVAAWPAAARTSAPIATAITGTSAAVASAISATVVGTAT